MKFVTTRNKSVLYSFEQVLLSGYAPDGGLFVPEKVPLVLQWSEWKDKTYPEIVKEVLKIFVDDENLPVDDLLKNVYDEAHFDNNLFAPVKKLADKLYVLELFHGPSWSFKDYALEILGELWQFYLKKKNDRICLLVATSGDTGSAAIEAVKNKNNIDIVVLMPHHRINKVQEMQMTTADAKNVHVISVDMCSDELDTVVKTIIADDQFAAENKLGSANSINIGRILIQIAHWFYGYFQVVKDSGQNDKEINFIVPVGGAGNLTAGFYAKSMGLPINIIACSNKNDAFHKFVQFGKLQTAPTETSLAVAMDIQVPYNAERMIHLLSDQDANLVRQKMNEYYETGQCAFSFEFSNKLRASMITCSVSDEDIESAMKWFHKKYSYACCPHTATTAYAARRFHSKGTLLCVSTSAPYKSPELFERLQLKLDESPRLVELLKKEAPPKIDVWPNDLNAAVHSLKNKIIEISKTRNI